MSFVLPLSPSLCAVSLCAVGHRVSYFLSLFFSVDVLARRKRKKAEEQRFDVANVHGNDGRCSEW